MSSYDSHSKHVILIAIVHILCYIFLVLLPAIMMACGNATMPSNEVSDIQYWFVVGYSFVMTILSGVMMRGVIKQRHVLIAPWLMMASLSLIGMIAIYISDFFIETDIFMGTYLETIGMEILVIYPTYTLYMKLRPKSLKQDKVVETKVKSGGHVLV